MFSHQSKYSRSFVGHNDKENNQEAQNIIETNLPKQIQSNKLKKNFVGQKSLPMNSFENKPTTCILSEHNHQQLQHSKTEDNLRELARKVNADKVKRSLNCDIKEDDKKENIEAVKEQEKEKQTRPIEIQPTKEVIVKEWSTQMIPQQIRNNVLSQREIENKNLLKFYSGNILDYMKRKEKDTTPCNSLLKHNIPTNLRAKMVDWMIEVLSSYKCTEQTFFLGVRVMDLFFQKTTKIHEISDLHLVGVTSMFIAGKYEEIYPFKLSIVYEKIAHRKLSPEIIKKKESDILQAIQFNLIGATPYEVTMHVLCKLNLRDCLEKKIITYLEKICIYLAKMILYDYELICQKEYGLLSGSLIFVAFKIIEQIDLNFKAEEKVQAVIKILGVNHENLIETAAKILNLAKNFDKLYPNLENLKKFNGFSLEESEQKKQIQTYFSQQQIQ